MITICDTGPLLAYLNRNDPHHRWAVAQMKQVRAPMLVCEPVLTEVVYFLREDGLAIDPLFQLLEREAIRLSFDLSAHWPRIRTLMSRYRQMDLADASVVVMTELQAKSQVLTSGTAPRNRGLPKARCRRALERVHARERRWKQARI